MNEISVSPMGLLIYALFVETVARFQEMKPCKNDGCIKPGAYMTCNLAEGMDCQVDAIVTHFFFIKAIHMITPLEAGILITIKRLNATRVSASNGDLLNESNTRLPGDSRVVATG
jgi:hypothetical protein